MVFLPDVPTFIEQGVDISDASVNYRGFMVPKGTPQDVIEFLAQRLPAMFRDDEVLNRMRSAGASMRIMDRTQVISLWQRHQETLEELLLELKEND